MKKISILLILSGLIVAGFPQLQRGYSWYWEQRLMKEFEAGLPVLATELEEETKAAYGALQERFNDQVELEENEAADDQEAEQPQETNAIALGNVLGILKIDKINLKMPILEGTTERNLNRGAAQIEGTSPLGAVGNAAIAGHRGYNYGRLFNRLDELMVGDKIVVETGEGTYTYEVYQTLVVEPADVSVLNRNNQDKILTLVTCTPLYTSTHRLIVQAKAASE